MTIKFKYKAKYQKKKTKTTWKIIKHKLNNLLTKNMLTLKIRSFQDKIAFK